MMKKTVGIGVLAALFGVLGSVHAQATTSPPKKAVTQMSCKDYVELDETFKPKFIYFALGHTRHGKPEAVEFDVDQLEKVKPSIDEYCKVNLTASAYKKVMAESIASEKAMRHKR